MPGKAAGAKGSRWGLDGGRVRRGQLPYPLLPRPQLRVAMAESEEERGAAVELSGLPPDFSDELLMLYFENHRRSGGGPLLGWQRLSRGGVLTFQEAAGEGPTGRAASRGTGGPLTPLSTRLRPPARPQTPPRSWPSGSTCCRAPG